MMEEQQKQIAYHTDYNIQVSDMCSELHYFVIFDFPHTQVTSENMARKPTIVTFRYEDINFKEILKRYTKLCTSAKDREHIRFSMSRGFIIPMRYTVLELKKRLRKDSIDGVVLFTFEALDDDDEQEHIKIGGDYVDECGLMDYIQIEKDFNIAKKFTFHFLLPNTKFVISILIHPSEKVKSLLDEFFKEVKQEFQIQLTLDDIKDFKILQQSTEGKSLDKKKSLELISKYDGLFDEAQISVILKDKNLGFIKKVAEVNIITLIKEAINPQDNKVQQIPIKLNYEQIKGMQVNKIHEQFILQKNQYYNKNNPVCLKVMEIIIKGEEKLMKLNFAIQKLKQLGDVKLVGFFISQKVVFYKEIPLILKTNGAQQFTLEQLEIPSTEMHVRYQCDQKISQRLETIKEDYFKDKKHVQPIFIYTSNLRYKDKNTGNIAKIYDSLNKCLRTQSVLQKKSEDISKEWVYRYTSTLLKHLDNIHGQKCKVYRGVNYDPEGKIGSLMTFKPFTSTSKSQSVAIQFALQNIMTQPNLPLVIFQMNILYGKPISQFSYFGNIEEELLLQPFTQFRIINKTEKVMKKFPDIQGGQYYPFTIYELQEINSSKEMPQTINNYILWVDDKPNEGREIFNKFIQQFYYPTVLFQIPSTQKLKEWIEERQNIINDSSSKIIMVTNMVRKQNEQRNFYAGVQSINLIRQTLPKIPIAVYVRDINASNNNLNEKNVHRDNLVVISQFEDLADFASKHTCLKFKSFAPSQEEPLHQTAPTYTKSHSTSSSENKKSKSTLSKQPQKGQKGICNIM